MNVVDNLVACSLRSSNRLGGYSAEPADEVSRLMAMRLGEGASGGLEALSLGVGSTPLHAVTITNKIESPTAGTVVLKTKSIEAIPSIMGTLV